jgi:hypothetical protein
VTPTKRNGLTQEKALIFSSFLFWLLMRKLQNFKLAVMFSQNFLISKVSCRTYCIFANCFKILKELCGGGAGWSNDVVTKLLISK